MKYFFSLFLVVLRLLAKTKPMAYFNYHAKAISLIKENHCTFASLEPKHNQITPALVLHFDNHQPMPIREHKWPFYFSLLSENNIEIHNHLSKNM